LRDVLRREGKMEHKELKSSVGKKSADIWAAYQEVLKELKAKEGAPASTAEVAKKKQVVEAICIANGLNLSDILAKFDAMSAEFRNSVQQYTSLNSAIEAKKQELRDVHNLESEANAAVALVQAKDKLVTERMEQAASIIAEAHEEAVKIKDEAQFEAKHLAEVAGEKFKADEKARVRQSEEWEYKFRRECQAKGDAFNDDISKRARAALEREGAVKAREEQADAIDAKMKALQETINKADEVRGAAVAKAIAEAEAAARKSEAIQKNIIDRAHAADVSVLNGEIKSLKEQNVELRARLERAENQVSEANNRMTTIATASLRAGADAATVAEVAKVAAGAGGGKK
jgi:hypothetical protein